MKFEFGYDNVVPSMVLYPESGSDRDFLRWLVRTRVLMPVGGTPAEYTGGPVALDVSNNFAQMATVWYPIGEAAGPRMAVLVKKADGVLAVVVTPRQDLGHVTDSLIQAGYQPEMFPETVKPEDIVEMAASDTFRPGRFRAVPEGAVPHELLDNALVPDVKDMPQYREPEKKTSETA